MERWKLLTIIIKHSILDIAAALDPLLFIDPQYHQVIQAMI